MKGDQVGQAGPGPPKPMLAGSNPLAILWVLCDGTQGNLFHNLAGDSGQADRPGVSQILLMALLMDGVTLAPPVLWDLPSEPGLMINDGEQLHKLICQLPHPLGWIPSGPRDL